VTLTSAKASPQQKTATHGGGRNAAAGWQERVDAPDWDHIRSELDAARLTGLPLRGLSQDST
jgi:hypothetical protein